MCVCLCVYIIQYLIQWILFLPSVQKQKRRSHSLFISRDQCFILSLSLSLTLTLTLTLAIFFLGELQWRIRWFVIRINFTDKKGIHNAPKRQSKYVISLLSPPFHARRRASTVYRKRKIDKPQRNEAIYHTLSCLSAKEPWLIRFVSSRSTLRTSSRAIGSIVFPIYLGFDRTNRFEGGRKGEIVISFQLIFFIRRDRENRRNDSFETRVENGL